MANFFDFNDAEEQQAGGLLPAKTLVKVVSKIQPGGEGHGGYETISASEFQYLKMEFTVVSSPYAGRKIFQNVGIGGVTDGHAKAASISRSLIRAMLESGHGIEPKDETDKARKVRCISGWESIDELEFAVEVGIEKGKDGYEDRNKIQRVITPDHAQYKNIMAGNTVLPEGGAKSYAAKNAAATPPWEADAASKQQKSAVPEWAR